MVLWPPASTDDLPTLLVCTAAGLLLHLPVAWWLSGELLPLTGSTVRGGPGGLRPAFTVYQVLVPPLALVASYLGLYLASAVGGGILGLGIIGITPVLAYGLLAVACAVWLSRRSA
jgi:hypothetical protein